MNDDLLPLPVPVNQGTAESEPVWPPLFTAQQCTDYARACMAPLQVRELEEDLRLIRLQEPAQRIAYLTDRAESAEAELSRLKAQEPRPGWRWLKNTTYDERSWPEDAGHENGNYSNSCCECLRMFTGHKRRVVCRSCSEIKADAAAPSTQPDTVQVPNEDAST